MYGETAEVVVFSPNRGGAVVGDCWKYIVAHWRTWLRAWQSSWTAFCPCGDHDGILVAPVGVVVFPVEGTVLHAVVAERRGFGRRGVSLWSRPGPRSRVAPMPVEGSAAEKV